MPRILFFSENFCGDSSQGGLEVATFRIAKALRDSGEWEVYDAFRKNRHKEGNSIYADVIKLPLKGYLFINELKDFIIRNEIDVVVNMTRFFRHRMIHDAISESGRNIKLIFMQHFAPGSEMKKPTFKSGFHLLKLNPGNFLYWLRASVYPIIRYPRLRKLPSLYHDTYNLSDKLVLLSSGYRGDYKKIGRLNDDSKFIAIPNIFEPLGKIQPEKVLDSKKKRVLILSRMDEIQKRISLALESWKRIEESGEFSDWHLDIVGNGHDIGLEKRLAKRLGLKNVTFHGWQTRENFLENSPILIMTSAYEGLPLSLIEAQHFGCVPIAYDSFASVRDVIQNERNGLIVKEFGNTEAFAESLASLMRDSGKRNLMAKAAIEDSARFSADNIGSLWLELLKHL